MAIEDDVVVVGGGLAGLTAGLAAARADPSLDVRVLSHKDSTLKSASGLVDVLGYAPGTDAADASPIADPFDVIPELPDEHPYNKVGVEGVRAGLSLFDDVTGESYAGDHTDRNALVLTHGGTVKPTARYPASVAAGLASDDRETLLVGFETVTDFDAPLAADHLRAAGVPFEVRGVTVEFPGDFRADATLTRLAAALDSDEQVERGRERRRAAASGESGEGTTGASGASAGWNRSGSLPMRGALAETVAPHLGSAERVGFPALLGQHETEAVRNDLEAELGAAVFEVPMGPPSLPGMRLEGQLLGACRDAGVRLTTGNPVVGYETVDDGDGHAASDRVAALRVERNGAEIPFHADAVVLATGGLVGKGVESDREGVREPVFDCHVPQPDDRYDWFADDAFGDHPFARFGVPVGEDLRPRDADGDPEFANLWAAGAVLGGFDFAAEKSGSGVSLATGVAAGEAAASEVGASEAAAESAVQEDSA